jgi:hypothetical protein
MINKFGKYLIIIALKCYVYLHSFNEMLISYTKLCVLHMFTEISAK